MLFASCSSCAFSPFSIVQTDFLCYVITLLSGVAEVVPFFPTPHPHSLVLFSSSSKVVRRLASSRIDANAAPSKSQMPEFVSSWSLWLFFYGGGARRSDCVLLLSLVGAGNARCFFLGRKGKWGWADAGSRNSRSVIPYPAVETDRTVSFGGARFYAYYIQNGAYLI